VRGFAFLADLTEEERVLAGDQHQRCPLLALWTTQSPASGGKQPHKAKPQNRQVFRYQARGPAQRRNDGHSAANDAFSGC